MLEAHDLVAERGDARLFAGVGFSLEPGAALFVHGPNGSGKTTLLRILAGLTQAASGMVCWRGSAVGPFAPALRANALFIGHGPALKNELTVEENLVTLTRLHGAPADPGPLRDALAAWSLSRQHALPASVLSQGQRRRTSLARLHLLPRPLWLLDEPLAALDEAGMATLAQTLAEHLATGGSAVIATHQTMPLTAGTTRFLRLG